MAFLRYIDVKISGDLECRVHRLKIAIFKNAAKHRISTGFDYILKGFSDGIKSGSCNGVVAEI